MEWLDAHGETSWDYQSFFAGPVGGRAKALYYRHRLIGTAAVAPMIFCEAFLPSARRLFHHPLRFPIADAHYAMGFAFLYEATGDSSQLENAVHFLTELEKSRCGQFKEYCWGYPFDWVWRGGTAKRQTPLITTTPYVYEAFLQVSNLHPRDELKLILESIARHAVLTSRISKHRKRPAVVPILLSVKVELLTPPLIVPFCSPAPPRFFATKITGKSQNEI